MSKRHWIAAAIFSSWLVTPAIGQTGEETAQSKAQKSVMAKISKYCATATASYCTEFRIEMIRGLTRCIEARGSAVGIFNEIKVVKFPPQMVLRNMSEGRSMYLTSEDIAEIIGLAVASRSINPYSFADEVLDQCVAHLDAK